MQRITSTIDADTKTRHDRALAASIARMAMYVEVANRAFSDVGSTEDRNRKYLVPKMFWDRMFEADSLNLPQLPSLPSYTGV
jgi:hypothetical protein